MCEMMTETELLAPDDIITISLTVMQKIMFDSLKFQIRLLII